MPTVALLHFDNNLTDSCPSPHTYTAVNGATTSNAQSKFGGYSLLLNSASTQYLTTPDGPDFVFGTGDFCIDFWMRSTSTGMVVVDRYTANSNAWQIWINGGKVVWYTSAAILTSTASVNTGAWVHVEISRTSGVLYMFVDGALQGAGISHTNDFIGTTTSLAVGIQMSGLSNKFNGHIDELRIRKGVGGHTATFTPPTAAYSLLSVSGTVLDDAGAAAVRTVRLYNRSTGALIGTTTSDGAGAYSFTLDSDFSGGSCQVVCLDDVAGTTYNDLILGGVVPA